MHDMSVGLNYFANNKLTNDGQVQGGISSGRFFEVHSTSVDSLVFQQDLLQMEGGRFGNGKKLRPMTKHLRIRPVDDTGYWFSPYIKAEIKKMLFAL